MKIKRINFFKLNVPLKIKFKHASYERSSSENIVVEIISDKGISGFGESLPRKYVNNETVSDVIKDAEECSFNGLRREFRNEEELIDVLGNFKTKTNSLKCAVEVALLDLYGKSYGKAISEILTGKSGEGGDGKLRCTAIIPKTGLIKQTACALAYRLHGFKDVKVKVGFNGNEDVSSLAWIRRMLGRRVDLRVDANCAWRVDSAKQIINKIKKYNISYVEQPVKAEDTKFLSEIKNKTGMKMMVDESLTNMDDAVYLAKNRLCDMFNIRISKCGGIIPSFRIAKFAEKNNIEYQIGCQVGETGILSAAGRQLALSLENIKYFEGSYDRVLLRENIVKKVPYIRYGGVVRVKNSKSGLGIEVDKKQLNGNSEKFHEVEFEYLEHEVKNYSTFDGRSLFFREWPDTENRSVVIYIHGIESHSGWFTDSCDKISRAGYKVFSLDRRGSGLNMGQRGHFNSEKDLVHDIVTFISGVKLRYPEKKINLVGISWGGKLVFYFALLREKMISSLILIAPGLFPRVGYLVSEKLRIPLAMLLRPEKRIHVPIDKDEMFTSNPEKIRFIKDDKLRLKEVTARFLAGSMKIDKYIKKNSYDFKVSTLLLLSENDKVIDSKRTLEFFNKLIVPAKEAHIYPGVSHTLEFEKENEFFIKDILDWLDKD